MLLSKDLFFGFTKYIFKYISWFVWSVGSKLSIFQRFYHKNISRTIFTSKLCLHKFLQKQLSFQKKIIKKKCMVTKYLFC